ncbi:MAG: hypothetical protein AB7T10_03100 [bacterium]
MKKSEKKMLKMLEDENDDEKRGYILKELYLLTGKKEYRVNGLKALSSAYKARPSIYISSALKEIQQRDC